MNLSDDKVTEIFVLADDFCKEFENTIAKYRIGKTSKKKPRMTTSEVITIMILFYYGVFKNLKYFYLYYVKVHMKNEFPQTVSYNRFLIA